MFGAGVGDKSRRLSPPGRGDLELDGGFAKARRRHRLARIVKVAVVVLLLELSLAYLIMGSYRTLTGSGHVNQSGNPIGADFVQYYSASVLVRAGEPAATYDLGRLHAVEQEVIGAEIGQWPWYYPPTFLLVVSPLARMPYLVALAVWLFVGVGAYLVVVHRIAPHPATPPLALLFPAAGSVIFSGQNGCLSAALIGAGLVLLERRPVLAGVLFGLLSYKPQLGLLIPLALLAGGYWRAFAAAAITTLAFAAASLAVFGIESWSAFIDSLPAARKMVEGGESPWFKMVSVFPAARLLGADVATAWVLQGLAVAASVAAVIWIWRRPAPLSSKASVLVLAIPLSTPYAQFYDLAMLALPIAWLAWEGRNAGWLSGERLALAALWTAPVAVWVIGLRADIQSWPLVLAAMLALVLRRAVVVQRGAQAAPPEHKSSTF